MKHFLVASNVFALLFLLVGQASAGDKKGFSPLGDNAALRYWPAIFFLPKGAEADRMLAHSQDIPIDSAVREFVQDQKSLRYLSDGARIVQCDWGLEYKLGPTLWLPQLNGARVLAQLAVLRARVEFVDHRNFAAVDDLANVWAMARHVGSDKTFIGLLVRYVIERMANQTLQGHLQDLDKSEIEYLAKRFDSLPPGTLLVDTMAYGPMMGPQWLCSKARSAAAVDEPMDWKVAGLDMGFSDAALAKVSQMTPEEVIARTQSWGPYFAGAEKILRAGGDSGETEMALTRLRHEYATDPLADAMLPDYARAYRSEKKAAAAMAAMRAAIAAAGKKG